MTERSLLQRARPARLALCFVTLRGRARRRRARDCGARGRALARVRIPGRDVPGLATLPPCRPPIRSRRVSD